MNRAILIALAFTLCACATPALYAPSVRPGGNGFSEVRIEDNRYRVTFANAATETQGADFALLRAAELTLSQGYDWFVVDSRSSDRDSGSGAARPRISIGAGSSNWGGRTSVGVGAGVGFNVGGGAKTTVSMEIRLGRGPKPALANAYDARDVDRSIRSRM